MYPVNSGPPAMNDTCSNIGNCTLKYTKIRPKLFLNLIK